MFFNRLSASAGASVMFYKKYTEFFFINPLKVKSFKSKTLYLIETVFRENEEKD